MFKDESEESSVICFVCCELNLCPRKVVDCSILSWEVTMSFEMKLTVHVAMIVHGLILNVRILKC